MSNPLVIRARNIFKHDMNNFRHNPQKFTMIAHNTFRYGTDNYSHKNLAMR